MAHIQQLPTEILIEIFSNLDYLTLKTSVRPTCPRFNGIIQSTTSGILSRILFSTNSNDKKLFGAVNSHKATEEYCFKVHPCIHRLMIDCEDIKQRGLLAEQVPTHIWTENQTGFTCGRGRNFLPWRHAAATGSLRDEDALSSPIPVEEWFNKSRGLEMPFIICDSPNMGGITVGELVTALLRNNPYWDWDLTDIMDEKGFAPLTTLFAKNCTSEVVRNSKKGCGENTYNYRAIHIRSNKTGYRKVKFVFASKEHSYDTETKILIK